MKDILAQASSMRAQRRTILSFNKLRAEAALLLGKNIATADDFLRLICSKGDDVIRALK